jgi:xanthine dehydrogenase accessory factor
LGRNERNRIEKRKTHLFIRDRGDLVTGIFHRYRLYHVGYLAASLGKERTMVVRRTVSAVQTVFEGIAQGEDIEFKLLEKGEFPKEDSTVPVWIDPEGESKSISQLMTGFVIDAIMAKRNIGTHKDMAPWVISIGTGFIAG